MSSADNFFAESSIKVAKTPPGEFGKNVSISRRKAESPAALGDCTGLYVWATSLRSRVT